MKPCRVLHTLDKPWRSLSQYEGSGQETAHHHAVVVGPSKLSYNCGIRQFLRGETGERGENVSL